MSLDNSESVSAVQPAEPETRAVEQEKPFRQALLALLLQQDNELRALIQNTAHGAAAQSVVGYESEPVARPEIREVEKIIEVEKPVEVIKEVIKEVEVEKPDPLRSSLAQELHFLEVVNQDAEIKQMCLAGAGDEEGSQLVQMLARAAQWDEIEKLWDLLAQRCKNDQRAASEDELLMLTSALAVHNRIWQERKASLLQSKSAGQFNFEQHERVIEKKGELITGQCLPGLINAADKVTRRCLVRTVD